MAVFRVEKNQNYTVMANYHLKDASLSLKAKGLLSLMLSLPDDFYRMQLIYDRNRQGEERIIPFDEEMADNYLAMISEADTVDIYDWGLWIIARDEVTTYYTQDKSAEDVADALYSRYLVYAQENYDM